MRRTFQQSQVLPLGGLRRLLGLGLFLLGDLGLILGNDFAADAVDRLMMTGKGAPIDQGRSTSG